MKTGIIAGVLAAVLGMGTVADACHTARAHQSKSRGSVNGKITSVGKNSLSLTVASSAGNQVITVKYTKGTTLAGVANHGINSSLIGSSATVVGSAEGKTIKASEIVIAG